MQSHMYDIVFLDLEMPVMNGYRCAQAIRQWERRATCPVRTLGASALYMTVAAPGLRNVNRPRAQYICALTSHHHDHEQQLCRKVRESSPICFAEALTRQAATRPRRSVWTSLNRSPRRSARAAFSSARSRASLNCCVCAHTGAAPARHCRRSSTRAGRVPGGRIDLTPRNDFTPRNRLRLRI